MAVVAMAVTVTVGMVVSVVGVRGTIFASTPFAP
jgi:hypothetical protein